MASTLNQLKYKFLSDQLGVDGSLSALEYKWLARETGNAGKTTPLLWYKYLRQRGYTGALPQMLYKFLGDLGYEGTMNRKLYQFYGDYAQAGSLRLLGAEESGTAFDFSTNSVIVRDSTTPSKNFYGTLLEAITAGIASYTGPVAGTGTYVNSAGVIVPNILNVPRITHDPVTLAPLGYLPEPARTNICLRSAEFDTASWAKGFCSASANQTAAPDGATTADRITASASANEHVCNNLGANLTVAAYTQSFYLKAGTYGKVVVSVATAGRALGAGVQVDLVAGTIGAPINFGAHTGATASIQNVGNGWYRVTVTATATVALYYSAVWITDATYTYSWTPVGNETIFMWGAQLELGAYPTSYIPTTSASVARAADRLNFPLANIPWNDNVFTYIIDGMYPTQLAGASKFMFSLANNVDTTNHSQIYDNVGSFAAIIRSASATQLAGTGIPIGVRHKVGVSAQLNDGQVFMDGVAQSALDTSLIMPTGLTHGIFGYISTSNTANLWGEPIASLVLIPRRLSEAEMITRTT